MKIHFKSMNDKYIPETIYCTLPSAGYSLFHTADYLLQYYASSTTAGMHA